MKVPQLLAFGSLRVGFLHTQRCYLASKAGVSEVLKNSSHLRVRVSKVLEYEGEFRPKQMVNISKKQQLESKPPHKKRHFHGKGPKRDNIISSLFKGKQKHHNQEGKPGANTATTEPTQYITQVTGVIRPKEEELRQIHKPRGEAIPKLAHKLDRVLFSPGVHFLQDPRTRVYNFNPYLKKIVSHEEFDFEKVQNFVSASKDETLLREAKAQNKKFYSSTSSMTLTLHQFYLFLNNYSPSEESKYRFDFPNFSRTARDLPLAVLVEPKGVNEANGETIYSVTSDKSTDVEILLSAMGHCLEALLTTEEEEFKGLLVNRDGDKTSDTKECALDIKSTEQQLESSPSKIIDEAEVAEIAQTAENVYNYLGYGDFLMRSQLDCFDSRLPGNGTFDLKTRAAASVRYDKASEASDSNYQIWKLKGNIESFQREYEDLIRTGGLLKYGFQARIGQMDGIFVAYHNISSFFGFQYLPLSEIDKVFYSNTRFAQRVENYGSAEDVEQDDNMPSLFAEAQFKASIKMWQDVMKTVEKDFKGTKYEGSSFRLVTNRVSKVKRRGNSKTAGPNRQSNHAQQSESFLSVFAVPITSSEAEELQLVSSKYQTSFREEITDAERLKNLEDIQRELNEFNEKLVEKKHLFSYVINASLYVNGICHTQAESHQYPSSSKDDIEWRYNIKRICKKGVSKRDTMAPKESSRLSIEKYLQATQLSTNMLTKAYKEWPQKAEPSLTDILRKYSEVGKIRLEKWEKLENPPKTY